MRLLAFTMVLTMLLAPAAGAVAADDEKGLKEVVAEGAGTTEKEALSAAFRAAVQQVVGAFVSAENRVENDKLIKENILTVSDGFVKSHKVISSEQDKGLVRVTIRAMVKQDRVYETLVSSKVTVVKVPDAARGTGALSDVAVEKMTKDDAQRQKTKLLRDMMEEYPKVIFAQAREPDSEDFDKDAGKLIVDVHVLPDMKAYESWHQRLQMRVAKVNKAMHSGQLTGKPVDLDGKLAKTKVPGWHGTPGDKEELRGPLLDKQLDSWCLWLMTHSSGKHSNTRWTGYVLDAELDKVLRPLFGQLMVKMDLLDGKGERIAGEEFSIQESDEHAEACWLGRLVSRARDDVTGQNSWQWPLLRAVPNAKVSNTDTRNVYLAPYFITGALGAQGFGVFYAPERTYRREVNLSADEWKRVKEIRCALAFRVEQPPKE